jgi:CTD kinase subunit gamma
MRFTTLLTHLAASTTSLQKTAHYALKHRDLADDLHSCILETLERGSTSSMSMNNRANIMYFLEQHVEMNLQAGRSQIGESGYVAMVRRDIGRIVEGVCGGGGRGENVKVCRRIVGRLGEMGILSEELVGEIEQGLREKEEKLGRELEDADGEDAVVEDKPMKDVDCMESNKVTPKTRDDKKPNGVSKVDKRAIEQRIEEDRERNKRLRESVWAVNGDDEQELEKMWEEGSDLNEDDYVIAEEECEERLQFARYHRAMVDT